MDFDNLTDEELCARAQSGDIAAIDVLIGRYRTVVKSVVHSYFLSGGDKEDLLQEASASTVNGDEDPILPCQLFLGKSRYFSDEKKGKRLAEEGAFQTGIAAVAEKLLEP